MTTRLTRTEDQVTIQDMARMNENCVFQGVRISYRIYGALL